ncbi:HlyD family secretion protein [Variovorax sp. J22R133]|uniref:HlyD family secretion protein n=1 Tax=Variovorax brevis TaxID=3053503 RepID=UPI0025762D13|nr:HlyD family secretion protein [Variovorax sp. J22R133]MDM0112326.1 HlyD family secretion protein [Variovorax sp. J22R133]
MDAPRNPLNRATALVLMLALAGVLLVLYAWRLPPFRTAIESTENAYVRGSITVIAPKVDGYVAQVLVQDFAEVKAGQVLVQLDDRNYRQRVAQAQASLAAAQANLDNVAQARRVREAGVSTAEASVATALAQQVNASAQLSRTQADQRRADALVPDGSISQRERDQTEGLLRQAEAARTQAGAAIRQARAGHAAAQQDLRAVIVNRRSVEASVETAQAAVQLAEIDLENTRIRAPRDGHVGEVGVKLGQYVTPGTQLMVLVPAQVWVVANFKEAQTSRMREGQPAALRVDALADAKFKGRVERLSPATGSEFSVIRADNATGNFTKIPQRLPVRIAVDMSDTLAARLRPGMSVFASVDTSSSAP